MATWITYGLYTPTEAERDAAKQRMKNAQEPDMVVNGMRFKMGNVNFNDMLIASGPVVKMSNVDLRALKDLGLI